MGYGLRIIYDARQHPAGIILAFELWCQRQHTIAVRGLGLRVEGLGFRV